MNYQSFWIGRVLNAFSQLFNAVFANGDPDVSISAKIGYENYFYKNWFYKICGLIVDFTFYPLDGKDHCRQAYLRDRKEDYAVGRGLVLGEIFTAIIVVLFCIPLSILFYIYHAIKLCLN